MNGHVKLNMENIFENVLMFCSETEQISSTSLEDTDHESWHGFSRHSV